MRTRTLQELVDLVLTNEDVTLEIDARNFSVWLHDRKNGKVVYLRHHGNPHGISDEHWSMMLPMVPKYIDEAYTLLEKKLASYKRRQSASGR